MGIENKPGFFTSTGNIVAAFMTMVAFGSIVFAWGVKSEKKETDVSSLKEDVEEIRLIVKPLKPIIDTIADKLDRHTEKQDVSLKEITKSIDEVSGKQDKLKTLVTSEFAKSMTPKQVNEMWNMLEKKNNDGMNSLLIPCENLINGRTTSRL